MRNVHTLLIMAHHLSSRTSGPAPRHVLTLAEAGQHLAALHEWGHTLHGKSPEFRITRSGPDHAPIWGASLRWQCKVVASSAATKQEAMTKVAKDIMEDEMKRGKASLEERIEAQEKHLAALEVRIDEQDRRIEEQDRRIAQMEEKVNSILPPWMQQNEEWGVQ